MIAVSELERAYGGLKLVNSSDTVAVEQHATPNKDNALQVEITFLREQVEDLRTERDRLLSVIEEQAGTVRILTDQRHKQTPRSFWRLLFGKG